MNIVILFASSAFIGQYYECSNVNINNVVI